MQIPVSHATFLRTLLLLALCCLLVALVACTGIANTNDSARSPNSFAAGNSGNRGPSRQILYSVNFSNTGTDVTAFRVNSDGSLTSLGTALQTPKLFARFASSGRHVFGSIGTVPSEGGFAVFNTLITFSAQPNGTLRQNFSTPLPSGTSARGAVLNPAGTFLFVVLTIPGQSNLTIATYAVSPSGKLALVNSGSGLSIPPEASLAINPTGTFLYASILSPDAVFTTILQFAISSTGALTQVGSFSTSILFGGINLAFTPNGNTLYSGPFISPEVTRFSVDPATGALTEQDTVTCTCFPTSDNGRGILVNPQGTLLLQLVSGEEFGGVAFYSIDPSTGALTPLSSFIAFGSPGVFSSFVLDSSGTFVYATDQGLGILGFSISASGAVTPVPGSPFPEGGGGSLLLVDLKP
jgi:6-phosphogluconolactonase (cycloisomerase 2 family)